MDFQTLKSNVESYILDTPGETSNLVPLWINAAIRRACERHNFQFMKSEVAAEETTDVTRKLLDKPAEWKETRGRPWLLHQDGSSTEIDWMPTESEAIRLYGQAAPAEGNTAEIDEGQPRYLFEREAQIDVYPFPDTNSDWDNGNYRVYVPYWAYPADLSDDTDTNWVTQNMSLYVIYYAAAEGFLFNREEERAQVYKNMAEKEFRRARSSDKMAQLPDRPTLIPKAQAKATRRRGRL